MGRNRFLMAALAFGIAFAMVVSSLPLLTNHAIGQGSSTIYVDASNTTGIEDGTAAHPYNTIQEGIDAAFSGDTVQVAAGTYYENITLKDGVSVQGAGADVATIDGSTARGGLPAYHVVVGADNATLDGFTVTGGNATGADSDACGGGMYASHSSPTVTNCIFYNNHANNGGGGMYTWDSWSTVTNCTFHNNIASWGGGMHFLDSSPTITNCTFSSNSASYGGGIYTSYSSPTVTKSAILDNSAHGSGGGICVDYYGSLHISNSLIIDNYSAKGGAIFGTAHVSAEIINNTIYGNSVDGVFTDSDAPFTIVNNIIWNNGDDLRNCSATYSAIEDGDPGEGNISADPLFVDPTGGDYHLLAGSPCIDAGTNEGAPIEDMESDARPSDGDGDGVATTDMGAYECVPPPIAIFGAQPNSGLIPLTVEFTDQSKGFVMSWSWDFGDGGTSSDQNPSHIYTASGVYTVSLTVIGPGGSNTETKVEYVSVYTAPQADFSASLTQAVVGQTIEFTDSSTGDITSWSWDFDNDGTVDSTEQNPSHTYANPGTYTVSLTVSNPAASDTETKVEYIEVIAPTEAPVASFTASPGSGTAPLTVHFTDESTGDITNWEWDFNNDGIVDSTEQNPSYTYGAPGKYTVSLKVSGPGGSDTEVKSGYITVEVEADEDGNGEKDGEAGGCGCASVTGHVSANELLIGWAVVGLCWGSGYYLVRRASRRRRK